MPVSISGTDNIVLQVVNATYSTQVSSSSSTYADTNLTATITPKFATSKILVLVNHTGLAKVTNSTGVTIRLVRNGTTLTTFENSAGQQYSTAWNIVGGTGVCYYDSPASTSALTYKTQFISDSNNAAVYIGNANCTQTITLLEISS